jgi:hypothetical protein
MAGGEATGPSAEGEQKKGRVARALAWVGENFFKSVLAALATVLVSAGVALLVNQEDTSSQGKTPPRDQHPPVRFDSWPDGVSAWTVVLASEATRGLAESAVEKAKRVSSRGLNIGVLHSSDYASLRAGYWVTFAGQFDSVDEAQQAAERYRGQFPSAYQRFIEQR